VSVKALSAVFEDSRARDSAFVVLLAMADWADHNGWCYPSYDQIGRKARVSRSTAKRAIAGLLALGELERVRKGKAPTAEDEEAPVLARIQSRNLYRILLLKPRAQVGPVSAHLEIGVGSLAEGSGSIDDAEVGSLALAHIRNSPSSRPSDRPSNVQAGAPPRAPAPDDPEKNLDVITKIAHEAIDLLGVRADLGALAEAVKSRCSRLHVCYSPGDVVRRAIDSALWQRRRRTLEAR
jgi:hypothetical protein